MASDPRIFKTPWYTLGSPDDAKATDATSAWTMIACLKGIWDKLNGTITVSLSPFVDKGTFTPGTTNVSISGGVYQAIPDAVTDGKGGGLRMTSKRALLVTPETPNGDSLVDDTNDVLRISAVSGQGQGPGGAGAVTAATPRVILASDDPVAAASVADDAPFTPAVTRVVMAGFTFDAVLPDSVDEGDAGAARMSANRCIYVNIRDNAGNERGLNIDGNGALALGSLIPGVAATSLGKAEDAAHTDGDTGVMMLAVRQDTEAALAGTTGDYIPPTTDATGRVRVNTLQRVSTATLSAVASLATSAQLIAANAARQGLLIVNTDANDLYIKYGITASLTDFSVRIPASGYWEMPLPIYTGRIDAIWAADGSGQASVTEL